MFIYHDQRPDSSSSVRFCPEARVTGCYDSSKVYSMIIREIDLNISSTFFWTDSQITLQYIRNESCRFKTYVANRVCEVRQVSEPTQWRHCPGNLNPANDASRGLSAQQFLSSDRWFAGPAFLSQPEAEWPTTEIGDLLENNLEVKVERLYSLCSHPIECTNFL